MIRRLPLLCFFAALAAGVPLVALSLGGCESETGPGAPARTNGCIDTSCQPIPVDTSTSTPTDSGAHD